MPLSLFHVGTLLTRPFSSILKRTCTRHKSLRIVYHTDEKVPYRNLAFEEWIYDNVDLSFSSCMFIWRSLPSVVVGRHQNPWTECNLQNLRKLDIFLARRQTGGGTVYHDSGNVNITFFTPRALYDRKLNLNLIISALSKKWTSLNLNVNDRDDIILDGKYKISGSAAKLGRFNAYHHCTLLYDSKIDNMSAALLPSIGNVTTKATSSVRSVTKNLSSYAEDISYESIRDCLIDEYLSRSDDSTEKHVVYVNPVDNHMFNGISKMLDKLNTWEWIYGKTPKFTANFDASTTIYKNINVELSIVNGIIDDVQWMLNSIPQSVLDGFSEVLIGTKFARNNILQCWEKFTAQNAGSSDLNEVFHSLIQSIANAL